MRRISGFLIFVCLFAPLHSYTASTAVRAYSEFGGPQVTLMRGGGGISICIACMAYLFSIPKYEYFSESDHILLINIRACTVANQLLTSSNFCNPFIELLSLPSLILHRGQMS